LNVPAAAPLLVSLGRLHVKKRLDLLAAAFKRILPFHPLAQLVIAGPDEGDYRRKVESRFAAVSRWVHWTGELQDAEKWALLADATALVMCSDSENFGLVVLEALAAGVPVVVVQTCPWEEVQTARCGFWVPQRVDAIADALLALLRDPEGARAMGERGRALARAKYSWDAIARAMVDRYAAVIAARSGRVVAP
jgi:glycosyltransferase involved in cell wall biosynthesis